MKEKNYKLGTVEASEQLITDLYISLKEKVNLWASITHQTAQARMGYVGQHLVSVVTGYPGGRSGARGKDIIISNNEFAEIKTCYRIDQLGKCNACGAVVSSIELTCSECNGTDIKRNDDSKWLISIRHEDEFSKILEPKFYYLVLFDFTDMDNPTTIRASIWQIDPKTPGFALCMIDYYKNIRSQSSSKAPFNFWPFQLKFDIMNPLLIYRSYISRENEIKTEIFPNVTNAKVHSISPLSQYSQSLNLTKEKIILFATNIGYKVDLLDKSKKQSLDLLEDYINKQKFEIKYVSNELAKALYMSSIYNHVNDLPASLKQYIKSLAI